MSTQNTPQTKHPLRAHSLSFLRNVICKSRSARGFRGRVDRRHAVDSSHLQDHRKGTAQDQALSRNRNRSLGDGHGRGRGGHCHGRGRSSHCHGRSSHCHGRSSHCHGRSSHRHCHGHGSETVQGQVEESRFRHGHGHGILCASSIQESQAKNHHHRIIRSFAHGHSTQAAAFHHGHCRHGNLGHHGHGSAAHRHGPRTPLRSDRRLRVVRTRHTQQDRLCGQYARCTVDSVRGLLRRPRQAHHRQNDTQGHDPHRSRVPRRAGV